MKYAINIFIGELNQIKSDDKTVTFALTADMFIKVNKLNINGNNATFEEKFQLQVINKSGVVADTMMPADLASAYKLPYSKNEIQNVRRD